MQKVNRLLNVILKAAILGGVVNSVLLFRLYLNDMVFPNWYEKTLLLVSSVLVVILSIAYLILSLIDYDRKL